jgi:glucose-6-phosphate 1-dehydrogenase
LLGDAMLGDATLFARQDVVEAAWAIVDPVIHGPSPMYEYEPGVNRHSIRTPDRHAKGTPLSYVLSD